MPVSMIPMIAVSTAEETMDFAKFMKENKVRDAEGDSMEERDISNFLITWRNGRPLVMAFCPNRDITLMALSILIPGMGADKVIFMSETFGTTNMVGPNGEWGSGEMQKMVEAGRADEFGIFEQLMVLQFERGEEQPKAFVLKYNVRGKEVEWLDEEGPEITSLGGYIADSIKSFFDREPIDMDKMHRVFEIYEAEGLADKPADIAELRFAQIMKEVDDNPGQPQSSIHRRELHSDLGTLRATGAMLPDGPDSWICGYFVEPDDLEGQKIAEESLGKMQESFHEFQRMSQRRNN